MAQHGLAALAERVPAEGGLVISLMRMNRVLEVDPVSRAARIQAGATGPELEEQLKEHGMTLRHFPQSFEYATLGGFAATRSSGQASAGYGRFDRMVVGLRAATPAGTLALGRYGFLQTAAFVLAGLASSVFFLARQGFMIDVLPPDARDAGRDVESDGSATAEEPVVALRWSIRRLSSRGANNE